MVSIREWLEANGLGEYADTFQRQMIAFNDLADLTEADLREIGLSIGDRKRFSRARAEHFAIAGPDPAQAGATTGERRHVTVMFCDLVGSAGLGEKLEAEDLLAVLRHYRGVCRKAIERYDGMLARLIGDGVLAYFGYPTAHENDAERGIHAALEIIAEIGSLELDPKVALKVRIGIATGFVLVGDLFDAGEDARNEIVGSVPNLAARLQAFAPENAVVVSLPTWRLVRGNFTGSSLGSLNVRGFDRPVQAWRLLAERQDTDRPPGARPLSTLTPFVDREAELNIVRNLWTSACGGAGHALLITGEAGIGKSRLLAQFLAGLDPPPRTRQYFCSPFLSSSPLGPVAAHFSMRASFERGDSPASKLEKLATLVEGSDRERRDVLAGLAWLFSLPFAQSEATPSTPRHRREQALSGIAEQYLRLLDDGPLIGIIEDLHWADPTTLEFVELLLDRISDRPILLVLTCRERSEASWHQRPGLTHIEIGRLPKEKSSEMVRQLIGTGTLRPLVTREILNKTDGVPLFIEELTQSIVESRITQGSGDVPSLAPSIPATLHQLLLARLDHAGPGKELAQICAVIGRTADAELVESVANLEPTDLERARDALVRSGILFLETSNERQEQYVFKHSLVQDTAYASLMRERRRELHARVAAAQLRISPETIDLQPEVFAHHLTEAGRVEAALEYWLRAGRRGLQRSANLEATAHLRTGLRLLDSLPTSPERQALRLQFLTLLAPTLISVIGPGTTEVGRLFAEAVEICRSLPESPAHFPVYWGWWRVSNDFRVMRQRADDLLKRAQSRRDNALLLQAHHCQWASHFNAGNFANSAAHIDSGLVIYETGDYRPHASLYGNHDAKVCAHGERALIYWLDGNLDGALDEERRSLAWAQEIAHAGSRSHAMDFALMHRVYRRDAKRVLSLANEIIQFAEDQGFSDAEAKGLIFRGWAKALLGDVSAGVREAEVGILRQRDIGTTEDFPIYHCMLAEAHMLAGQVERGLDIVQQARRHSESTGLEIWLPELWRWLGVLGRRVGQDLDIVEGHFIEAFNIARRQKASMLELRAVLSLAALRQERGDISNSVDILEAALKAITGGLDSEERRQTVQFLSEVSIAER